MPFIFPLPSAEAASQRAFWELAFTVMRKGSEIGAHVIRFKHQGQERWSDGALAARISHHG